jgi:Ca-activated chloride channel family protein
MSRFLALGPMLGAGLWLLPFPAAAWDPFSRALPEVERGNEEYQAQHYSEALDNYEQAESRLQGEPRIHFNRGAALLGLSRAREAREAFLRAMGSEDPEFKKRLYYNLGNAFLAEQAFRDAAMYYRRVLQLDPDFDDARHNLELCIRAQEQPSKQSGDSQQKPRPQDGQDRKEDSQQGQNQDQKDQKDPKQDPQNQSGKEGQDSQDSGQQKDSSAKPESGQDQQQPSSDEQRKEGQDSQTQDAKDGQPDAQPKDSAGNDQKDERQNPDAKESQGQAQPKDADVAKDAQKESPDKTGKNREGREARRLSARQAQELLDALRESEKPFQTQRFMLPKFQPRDKKVEKDW